MYRKTVSCNALWAGAKYSILGSRPRYGVIFDSIVVRIPTCQVSDPGSIPYQGIEDYFS